MYQTDFDGYTRDDGCLLFSIFDWSRFVTHRSISRTAAEDLIDKLHTEIRASYDRATPAIGAEKNPRDKGVFVYDHEAVFNEACKFVGSTARWQYTGRIYMPWEEARGKKSFGRRDGDMIIMQILTANGNGHFRNPDYDPWEPGTEMRDLKSLRFYRLI